LSRRRDSLSFGHDAEVAAPPEAEQDFLLRKAVEQKWPVKRLRSEVDPAAQVGCARDQVRKILPGRGLAEHDDLLQLMVSDMVANARRSDFLAAPRIGS
jgi:hypothetical protein